MVLGIRGLLNVQGGVETHAEQLYPRLAALGCEVEALVRAPYVSAERRSFGPVRIRRLPSLGSSLPGLETFVHSVAGVIYASLRRPDVLHIHAVGPAIVTPVARLLGLRVVVTHHGPDYEREKWGRFARWMLRAGERAGMKSAHARIAVSANIAELVRSKHGVEADLIPNGVVVVEPRLDASYVRRFGLQPGRYFLHVGRMVPDKRQLDLIRAYAALPGAEWKLALVGGVGSDPYSREVQESARSAGAVLTGSLHGESLQQLYSHAGAFVMPSSHEGLPIAMLEALSYGLPVLASDIPANREAGQDTCSYFPLGDVVALAEGLKRLSSMCDADAARAARRTRVTEHFDWNRIARQTLAVYRRACKD